MARAIEAALQAGLSRYPDPMATAFRRRAAEVLGVEPDWILCGNGSDDILTIVTRAFVGAGQRAAAAVSELHPLQDAGPDSGRRSRRSSLRATIGRLATRSPRRRSDLRLAFLPNPNSPSGTMIAPERVLELAERLPCPLLVDEAYVDFADTNCLALVQAKRQDSWSRAR